MRGDRKVLTLTAQVCKYRRGVVLNSRMGGYGDYGTPEQAIPVSRPDGPWEFCVTINDSWGYRKDDHNHKSSRKCIWMLAECAGMGGNLLLDIGPKSDGTITPEQTAVLKGLGRWTHKHAEALYGTKAGLPPGHFYGPSTMNKSEDTLFLIMLNRPSGEVAVKGLRSQVRRASIVGGPELKHQVLGGAPWANLPGMLWIDVPEQTLDPDATVIKLELEGTLDLYTGSGDTATFN